MKRYTLALLVVSSSVALAGDPMTSKSKTKIPKPKPAPALNWFAGASGGYLLDKEADMWNGHIGVDLPWKLAGFDQSIFLEVGWVNCDDHDVDIVKRDYDAIYVDSVNSEMDVIPISINYKVERAITSNLAIYLGGGIGAAYSELDVSGGGDDEDWTFYAQVFGGLVYNITENFEVYAGARWIYLDEPEFKVNGTKVNSDKDDSDWLLEAGGRVNF